MRAFGRIDRLRAMLRRSHVRFLTALLALSSLAVTLLGSAAPAGATLPQQGGAVAAFATTSLQVVGSPSASRFGSSVAIGDVNGDGVDDMIVGALEQNAAPAGAYVIYGGGGGEPVHLALAADGEIPASEGFRIVAPVGSELLAGRAVADAGDVNGDGYDDVLVGANGIAHNYGGAFVVYGGPDDGTVELAEAGLPESVGFMLKAPGEVDNAGISVAGGEDVNGDGIDDIVIGDGGYDPTGPVPPYNTGAAFVVYGRQGERPTVALGSLASDGEGFAILGPDNNGYMEAVGMAGDVDGDGIGDVIVGDGGPYFGTPFGGFAAVVYGSADRTADVALTRAGLDPSVGFMVESSLAGDGTGTAVSGSGDVNGDGLDDVVIGAPRSSSAGAAGNAYVVYGGQTGTVTLDPTGLPPAVGFVVHGPAEGSLEAEAGLSVAGGADVNGDGVDDTVIAAPYAGYLTGGGSVPDIGEAAVVYGVPGGRGGLTLPAPDGAMDPADGFTVLGPASGSFFGGPAASQTLAAGDVNGDGRADVLVGSYDYGGGGLLVGALGFGTPTLAYPASASLTVGETLDVGPEAVGRTGAASFSVSPPLPAGLSLDPATGRIAGAPAAPLPSTAFTVTMHDLVGDAAAEFRLTVAGRGTHPGGEGGGGEGGGGTPGGGTGPGGGSGAGGPGGPPAHAVARHLTIGAVRIAPRTLTVDAARKVRRARLVLRLSRPAVVRMRIKGGGRKLSLALGRRPAGRSSLDLGAKLARRALRPGRYRAVLTAVASGHETARRSFGFRIVERGRG